MVGTLVMARKSVTFRRHDHLVSVLFGDLLSHSYNITFSMFLNLVQLGLSPHYLLARVVVHFDFYLVELLFVIVIQSGPGYTMFNCSTGDTHSSMYNCIKCLLHAAFIPGTIIIFGSK